MNNRKEAVCVVILTLLMTFMEMTALPASLFCNIIISDIEPICFSLMLNFLIAFMICWGFKKLLIKNWSFDLHTHETLEGLKKMLQPESQRLLQTAHI